MNDNPNVQQSASCSMVRARAIEEHLQPRGRFVVEHFRKGDDRYLDSYSDMALRRVWGAVRLSWQLTKLLHVFPDEDAFESRIKASEFDYLQASPNAQAVLAEQYAGLPFEE